MYTTDMNNDLDRTVVLRYHEIIYKQLKISKKIKIM